VVADHLPRAELDITSLGRHRWRCFREDPSELQHRAVQPIVHQAQIQELLHCKPFSHPFIFPSIGCCSPSFHFTFIVCVSCHLSTHTIALIFPNTITIIPPPSSPSLSLHFHHHHHHHHCIQRAKFQGQVQDTPVRTSGNRMQHGTSWDSGLSFHNVQVGRRTAKTTIIATHPVDHHFTNPPPPPRALSHNLLTYLPYLPTLLPTYLLTYLPTYLHIGRDVKSFNFLIDGRLNSKIADLELGIELGVPSSSSSSGVGNNSYCLEEEQKPLVGAAATANGGRATSSSSSSSVGGSNMCIYWQAPEVS